MKGDGASSPAGNESTANPPEPASTAKLSSPELGNSLPFSGKALPP
jgi:hypothetical protein